MWRIALCSAHRRRGPRGPFDCIFRGILSALTALSRLLRPFVHWRHLLRQSDDASSHLCGCTQHSNPTSPRLPPASSTILWTSYDNTWYYHALDGGFASKQYAYSHLLALGFWDQGDDGYWGDLWSCSGSMFVDTACTPGRGAHGGGAVGKEAEGMVSADADLRVALWAGGDTELIHVCPDVPDMFRRPRR
jgi:hypothetical protein